MPEGTTDPADNKQGQGTPPAPPQGGGQLEPPKTFTQSEMDAVVQDRLRRNDAKFSDYDDLKAKAARLDEAEEASKSELEKATGKATTEAARADIADARADRILRQSVIMAEATSQGAADAETIVALLATDDTITLDGDQVKGAKQAVKKLLEAKPFLAGKTQTPSSSGPAFGGQESSTLADQIAEAEKAGDITETIRLKTARLWSKD